MGDGEVLLQAFGHPLHQRFQRNGGGVGCDNGTFFAHVIKTLVQILFEARILDNRLAYPVAIGDEIEIVFKIPGGHQPCILLMHEGCGLGFQHGCDRAFGQHIPVLCIFGDDIQQYNRNTCIGNMGGNRCAHDTCANNGNFLNSHD